METMQFCHSCGMPLQSPMAGQIHGNFCGNCATADGTLNPREAVQTGIAHWLLSFSPDVTMDTAMIRADHYLRAMPAWAE
ncbi:MAG: hypothetical protein JXX29_12680 [Deltaproteobacteria bacterium]|nr:hypothetical protein [Deltaproteobacteria bacterium]MBN2672531.1 hypothetical protein [Deltaproteobacteria bacterium]